MEYVAVYRRIKYKPEIWPSWCIEYLSECRRYQIIPWPSAVVLGFSVIHSSGLLSKRLCWWKWCFILLLLLLFDKILVECSPEVSVGAVSAVIVVLTVKSFIKWKLLSIIIENVAKDICSISRCLGHYTREKRLANYWSILCDHVKSTSTMWSTLRNEEKKHFWREFEKWHHVKFEFEFDYQELLLDKIIEPKILRAREIGLRIREICQNWRFLSTRRGISRARERHEAESRVACCICVLLRSPRKPVLTFFRRNYWTCRVCVHAKEQPKTRNRARGNRNSRTGLSCGSIAGLWLTSIFCEDVRRRSTSWWSQSFILENLL